VARARAWRALLAVGIALLLALQVAVTALAASVYGETSCPAGKTVNISSRASTNISHSWAGGGYQEWFNPWSELRTSWTNYQSTWRVLTYDSSYLSFSGYCVQ